MGSIFMRFPGGKTKTLTLSYDDGVKQDVRLLAVMKANGLKGTFNLNSGRYAGKDTANKLTKEAAIALFKDCGMEVAAHGLTHAYLEQLPSNLCTYEVLQDRINLEEEYGRFVRGLAYPYGTYNDSVVETLRQCGIVYARTAESTGKFDIPTDWLRLPATCKHTDPALMELARQFVEEYAGRTPHMFLLWGHSFEFDRDDNWKVIEEFAEYVGNREDIWYASVIEIYDYIAAYNQLIFRTNGRKVYNPTNTVLYLEAVEGKSSKGCYCVKPGETTEINW